MSQQSRPAKAGHAGALDSAALDPAALDPERLAPEAQELLDRLAGLDQMQDFYLAGSAALSLYLDHRRVRDLDLMGYNRLASPDRRDLLQDLLAIEPGIQVETARDGFLFVRLPPDRGGIGLRWYYYPYPLIDAEEEVEGVSVASLIDLGLMKLAAIVSRGSRRDFVDLFLLCQHRSLETLLERSSEKFGHVRDFPARALAGLADSSLVSGDPMPEIRDAVPWASVEQWLDVEVRQIAREWVGLE